MRDRTPLKKGQITTLALRDEFRRNPALPILVGDDIFIRGLRRGIEQGEYVYRRGDLLFGPGDPPAGIEIDEQAVIFTMAYAKNTGIWPRKKPDGPAHPPTGGGTRDRPDAVKQDPEPYLGGKHGGGGPVEEESGSFSAEGILKEALTLLWEQARAKEAAAIDVLTIRMFEAGDAFRLLGAVGAVAGADKRVTIVGGYETREGGSLEMEFSGPVADAQPLREFLEPQLRDARSRSIEAGFQLTFAEGLPMTGDAAEKLTERLSRFASGGRPRVGNSGGQDLKWRVWRG